MIKAGIIGGAGYTAGELIRLLINHPDVEIHFINSSSNAGNKITDVHMNCHWMKWMWYFSVRHMVTRASLWKATTCPKT